MSPGIAHIYDHFDDVPSQHFNEIMPAIYSRFMEKEARQWRQIYKARTFIHFSPPSSLRNVTAGIATFGIPGQEWKRACRRRRSLPHLYREDVEKLLLRRRQGQRSRHQWFVTLIFAKRVLTTHPLLLVRNRSKEIVELLADVEKIRAERRKAKTNKSKYTGVGSDGWGPSSTGSRYGGFGNDSFSSGGGGNYGGSYGGNYDGDDDGGYSGGGSRSGGDGGYSGGSYSGSSNSKRFQEYDAGDDETPRRSSLSTSDARPSNPQHKGKSALSQSAAAPTKAPTKPPAQEVDLLGFADDDAFGSGPALPPPTGAPVLAPPQPAQPAGSLDGTFFLAAAVLALANIPFADDDFDDFQAAPPPATSPSFTVPTPQPTKPVIPLQPAQQFQPIRPVQPTQQPNPFGSSMNVMSHGSRTTTPSYGVPNYNINTSIMSSTPPPSQQGGTRLASGPAKPATTPHNPAKPATAANFDDLWNLSLGTTSTANKPNTNTAPAKSMKDLEKEKSAAGIWGAMNQNQSRQPTMGGGLWGPSSTTATNTNTAKPSGGVDDLLF